MRKILIVLLGVSVFWGCKVQKKTPSNQGPPPPVAKTAAPREAKVIISSVTGKYLIVDSSSVKVFMNVEIQNLKENAQIKDIEKIFKVQWHVQADYNQREKLKSGKIDIDENSLRKNGNFYQLTFDVPKIKGLDYSVLILEFIDVAASLKYTNDLPVDFTGMRVDSRFGLFKADQTDFPSFETFVKVGDPVIFKSWSGSKEKLYLKRYLNKTLPALSPMSSSKRNVMDEVSGLEAIEVDPGSTFTFKEEGIYVLTQDTLMHKDGYSILVTDERYPRFTQPDKLKEPVVYMSTGKEIESLKTQENAKDAVDLHFLSLSAGNQDQARQTIRSYYRRVSEANKLFSTYKEGWKTDKGMVYIILGPPTRVQRNRQREVWLYQGSSEIIFTFYRKPNSFTENHYELVRYPEYGAYWYPFVETWRTGNVVE